MSYGILYFLNIFKIGSAHKYKTIYVDYNNKNMEILKTFLKLNIIKSYKINDHSKFKKIKIFLNFNKNALSFIKIKHLSKPTIQTRVKIKALNIGMQRNFYSKSVYILSTSSGYKTNLDCAKKKICGIALIKFFL